MVEKEFAARHWLVALTTVHILSSSACVLLSKQNRCWKLQSNTVQEKDGEGYLVCFLTTVHQIKRNECYFLSYIRPENNETRKNK